MDGNMGSGSGWWLIFVMAGVGILASAVALVAGIFWLCRHVTVTL